MISAKVIVEGEVKKINIPTKWEEVTFSQFLVLEKTKDIGIAFFGIKEDEIDGIEQIAEVLKFLRKKKTVVPEWIKELNIGRESWKKLEKIKQLLKGKEPAEVVDKLISVYYPDINILTLPALEGIGAMNFFIDQLNSFFNKFKRLNDYKPDQDEILAGVNELEKYGNLPTLMSLCNSPLEYEAMLNLSAQVIYYTLLVSFEKSEIQKKLHEIKSKK
jgi:hypothetical protein